MTQNLRIIFNNLHDSGTVSATSEALPAAYTQRSGRSYVWRSAGTDTQMIDVTLPSPSYINSLIVLQHNITVGGRIRLELILSGSVVFDSGERFPSEIKPLGEWAVGVEPWGLSDVSLLPTRQFALWLPSITLCDSYRITIMDSGNPDGYLQVGRLFAGRYYSPEYNPSYGLTLTWQDFGENVRTESGSLRTIGRGQARQVSFDLDILQRQGLSALTTELSRGGKESDVYISIYPERGGTLEASHAFAAKRDSDYATSNDYFNNWQSSLTFSEV